MVEIKKFIFNPFAQNTFVVNEVESKEAMIIDPGCYDDEEKSELEEYIIKRRLKIKYLVNTHCHIDHVLGNKFVKEKFNPDFLIPEKDRFLLDMIQDQAVLFGVAVDEPPAQDCFITEEIRLKLGNAEIRFLFTPGHTPGEYCVLFEKENLCFTGDVLFRESIGRTDLWGGNQDALFNSIKNKLFVLNDDVKIFPGHGDSSTIGYEKLNNPFMINLG